MSQKKSSTGDEDRWSIEWTYSPSNFFEAPLDISHELGEITIANGKVEAVINPECEGSATTTREKLHQEVNTIFMGGQLERRKTYELSAPSLHCKKGAKKIVYVKGSIQARCRCHADLTITDKDGNVVADTKAERISKQRLCARMAAKHSDNDIVKKIIGSFQESINDHDNSLIHLYEVREAMHECFGRENTARQTLDISKKRWSDLGRLANNEPLRQGRHRGKDLAGLRDATEDELKLAQDIAVELIVKYCVYLERDAAG